jgi:threonine/homoserine/homoserine lactone efflux protein
LNLAYPKKRSMLIYLTSGMVYGLSAGLSPGPLLALLISQTLRHGAREGIKVALAPFLSDLPIILLTTFLLSQLAGYRPLLGGITLVGGCVVLYLAYGCWRGGRPAANAAAGAPNSLRKGILVNLLNPHPYLFWLTVGAPTLVRAWDEAGLSAAAFLAGFYVCLVGSKVLTAGLVARSRRFFSGRAYVWLMRLLAVLLVGFAGLLVIEGIELLGGM